MRLSFVSPSPVSCESLLEAAERIPSMSLVWEDPDRRQTECRCHCQSVRHKNRAAQKEGNKSRTGHYKKDERKGSTRRRGKT